MMSNTLHLTQKYKWFDMVESGVKKQEYREIKDYYKSRLTDQKKYWRKPIRLWQFKTFDTVTFHRGYQKNHKVMVVKCEGISIGTAVPEWSDNWQGEVFVIQLGEIISKTNNP